MTGTPGPHLQEPAPFPLSYRSISCETGDWYPDHFIRHRRLFRLSYRSISCESQEDEEFGVKHAHWRMHPDAHPPVELGESSHHRFCLVGLDLQVVAQELDAP